MDDERPPAARHRRPDNGAQNGARNGSADGQQGADGLAAEHPSWFRPEPWHAEPDPDSEDTELIPAKIPSFAPAFGGASRTPSSSAAAPTERIPVISSQRVRPRTTDPVYQPPEPETTYAPEPLPLHEPDADPLPSRTRHRAKPKTPPGQLPLGARIASGVGEACITLGVFLVLFLVYELWWTNVQANQEQAQAQKQVEQKIITGQTTFNPGDGFAILYIPRIGKKNVIMQGVDKGSVLDKGAVGHYLTPKSAMPWDPVGNFTLAAHRNTHGEPFRYINKLHVGDYVIVEAAQGWFVYQLDKELPQTSPNNVGTIYPVPKDGPYAKAGQYITLTTCTPEFTSWYRLIWWGHLVSVTPHNGPPPPQLKFTG